MTPAMLNIPLIPRLIVYAIVMVFVLPITFLAVDIANDPQHIHLVGLMGFVLWTVLVEHRLWAPLFLTILSLPFYTVSILLMLLSDILILVGDLCNDHGIARFAKTKKYYVQKWL